MPLPRNEETDQLFQSILSLQNLEECYGFFDDLCTVHEIQSMAQRLAVARLLAGGESYQGAMEGSGASSATISRVKRCLEYGTGGYSLILGRLEENRQHE